MSVSREKHEGVDGTVEHRFLINTVQHNEIGKIFFIAGVGIFRFDNPIGKFPNAGDLLRKILMREIRKKYDLFYVDPFVQVLQPPLVVGLRVIHIAHRNKPMLKIHEYRGGGLLLAFASVVGLRSA